MNVTSRTFTTLVCQIVSSIRQLRWTPNRASTGGASLLTARYEAARPFVAVIFFVYRCLRNFIHTENKHRKTTWAWRTLFELQHNARGQHFRPILQRSKNQRCNHSPRNRTQRSVWCVRRLLHVPVVHHLQVVTVESSSSCFDFLRYRWPESVIGTTYYVLIR